MTTFGKITQEMHNQAKLTRELKKLEAEKNLKLEYADADHWSSLASKFGVRLPIYYHPSSETKYIKRMASKIGIDLQDFLNSTGFSTLKQLVEANKTFNCAAMCGILIEYADNQASYSA